MKKLILLICVLLCANTFNVIAQTSVPAGSISGLWTSAGSPYQIQGNILIVKDSTLTIEPGVTVEFQGHYKFNIQGRLLAIGTAADTITFTAANTTNGWKGIRFDNTPTSNDTSKIKYCKIQYGIATGTAPDNYGGGLYFYSVSKVIVSNSRIEKCKAFRGAAMYFNYSNCSPIISNNIITNNTNDNDGGGAIYCDNSSSPIISNNTISNNSSIGAGAVSGGITCSGGDPTIMGNTITNNSTGMDGGGISLSASKAIISNNIIANNSASVYGGGVYCGTINNPSFLSNIISNNTAVKGGGLFFTAQTNVTISENIICNNTASSYGGGMYCEANVVPTIQNSTITNNTAANGGALYCTGSSTPVLKILFYMATQQVQVVRNYI